jgi:hypothetical protein
MFGVEEPMLIPEFIEPMPKPGVEEPTPIPELIEPMPMSESTEPIRMPEDIEFMLRPVHPKLATILMN